MALATIGDRFALTRGCSNPEVSPDAPSAPETRPFGMRFFDAVTPVASLALPSYEYCPRRQIAVGADGAPLITSGMVPSTTGSYDGKDNPQEEIKMDYRMED